MQFHDTSSISSYFLDSMLTQDLWYQMSHLSQHTARLDQLTWRSQKPQGLINWFMGGPGLRCMLPHNRNSISQVVTFRVVLSEGSCLGAVIFSHWHAGWVMCHAVSHLRWNWIKKTQCLLVVELQSHTLRAWWWCSRWIVPMPWQVPESSYSESQAWWSPILFVNISRKWRPWAIMEEYHDWPLFPLLPIPKSPQTHQDVKILPSCVEIMPTYVADWLNFVKFWIFRTTIEIGFPPACAHARWLYGVLPRTIQYELLKNQINKVTLKITF